MKKRFLAILMAVAMVFTMLPGTSFSVFAAEDEVDVNFIAGGWHMECMRGYDFDSSPYPLYETATWFVYEDGEEDGPWSDQYAYSLAENITIKIFDEDGQLVKTLISAENPPTVRLKKNHLYAIEFTLPSDKKDRYHEQENILEFVVTDDGFKFYSDRLGYDEENDVVVVALDEIEHYYIPLQPDDIPYGEDPLYNVVDMDTVLYNDRPFPKNWMPGAEWQGMSLGITFDLLLTDLNTGKKYRDGDMRGVAFPLGEYNATLISGRTTNVTADMYTLVPKSVDIAIVPKLMTTDMFTVTAADKEFDGTTKVKLTVKLNKEDMLNGIEGLEIKELSGQEPVYDEVTAEIEGSFADATPGANKTINYTITKLNGADAAKYGLPERGLKGTLKGTITPLTVPDADGDGNPESDDNGDWIYEGSNYGRRYIPDQDSDDFAEPESDTEPGIYEGTKDGKKYVPDGQGNVEEVTGPDADGIYIGTKDEDGDGKPDNRYIVDPNGDGIPEKYYEFLDGELTWIAGSTADLTFTIDAPAENFKELSIGDSTVSSDNYDYVSGSTIITMDADYLNELKVGNYDVEAVYTDGIAATTLNIKEANITESVNDVEDSTNAKDNTGAKDNTDAEDSTDTGDDSNVLPWMFLATISALACTVTLIQRRKKA